MRDRIANSLAFPELGMLINNVDEPLSVEQLEAIQYHVDNLKDPNTGANLWETVEDQCAMLDGLVDSITQNLKSGVTYLVDDINRYTKADIKKYLKDLEQELDDLATNVYDVRDELGLVLACSNK